MSTQDSERKIEKTARRFYHQLPWYELFLYPLMLVGAVFYFQGKNWGGSLFLLAGLILSMVYLMLWFYPEKGWFLRLMAVGLSFGLLGCIFTLLHMQSDVMFLVMGGLALLAALILFFSKLREQRVRGDLIRMVLVLAAVIFLLF
ncbi:MAG: hypothetical protein ACP5O2_04765 [Bacteroidales bacterium]